MGATHYMPAPGIPPLRQAVIAFLERTFRIRVTPDRVVVTSGAKSIIFFTILALVGEGDKVLYPAAVRMIEAGASRVLTERDHHRRRRRPWPTCEDHHHVIRRCSQLPCSKVSYCSWFRG